MTQENQSGEKIKDLVLGALVQWTGGKGYGVITNIDDRTIQVRWDDEGKPSQFAVTDPPLFRVEITGQSVQRRSTGEDVSVLKRVATTKPTWYCRIFPQGDAPFNANVPEEDLRPLPITDPLEKFQVGYIGSMKKYRIQEVTRWYRVQHLHDDLVSLGQIQVDIKPHQVSVVHKVISNYPHRFLLCDEVGLGKTIEAGMVLKELRSRGGAQRVIAIVPPNLIRQWQFEMKTKFNESFAVLNTDTVRFLNNQGYTGNPFAHSEYHRVLCSTRWVANPKWAKLCAEVDWDFVIVDEAHHARSHPDGNKTNLYDLVHNLALSEHIIRRGMLLLTATPMQLNTHELYALIELLDPALFPSPEDFERHRQAVPGLSKLVEGLYQHGFPLPDEEPNKTVEQVAQWLNIEQQVAYKRLDSGRDNKAQLEALAKELEDKHRLSEVLIRNRKALVGGFMPRSAYRWEVELTLKERMALQAVEEYVQYGYQLAEYGNANTIGFVMVIFQKLMASSIAAIRASLGKRRNRVLANANDGQSVDDLEDRIDDDENASDVVGIPIIAADGQVKMELDLLDKAIVALDEVDYDSKAQVLVEKLAELFAEHTDEKVIIFTQFRETQCHIEERLVAKGWSVNLFHGQLKPEDKDRAIARFKNDPGPQVLVSTEAGGEGRNLQFCHLLVNYDLPWNPMKVEQRIGRVDRIGQDHAISIFNLWVKDTIEERVLDVLENRIRVFEETVGGLDPILGETAEDDIKKIMRTAEAQREAAINAFGEQIEEEIRNAQEAGELLGDFIMDTKSYRKEIVERILGEQSPISNDDFERFIGQILADVHTYINRTNDVYDLTFTGDFFDTHRRNLFPVGPKMRAVFRPDSRPDAEDIEFMAFGHRIIDAIVKQILDEDYEGVTGTRRIFADSELAPTTGWLFTYQFTTSGLRPEEKLMPVFVSDRGEIDVETGRRILQRAFQFDSTEADISPDEMPDNLDTSRRLAEQFASTESEKIENQARSEATERADREISRLNALFNYKERGARDKEKATLTTLNRLRESADESQRQILPVWEANLRQAEELSAQLIKERQRRIAEVEKYRYPQVDWALKALGRIEIVVRK